MKNIDIKNIIPNNGYVKYILLMIIIITINILIHQLCDYTGCNHWSNIFGHNLICNYCLDALKYIRHYQFTMYGALFTSATIHITQLIDSVKLKVFSPPGSSSSPPFREKDR